MYFIFVVVSLIAKKKNTTQTFLKEISDLITSQVYIFLCLLCSAFFSPFPVDTHTQTNSYEKYFLVCVRATHSLQSTYISRCSVLAAFISPFIFWFFHWWAAPVVSRYLKHTHTHTQHTGLGSDQLCVCMSVCMPGCIFVLVYQHQNYSCSIYTKIHIQWKWELCPSIQNAQVKGTQTFA